MSEHEAAWHGMYVVMAAMREHEATWHGMNAAAAAQGGSQCASCCRDQPGTALARHEIGNLPCHAMPRPATPCHTVQHHAMPCHAHES